MIEISPRYKNANIPNPLLAPWGALQSILGFADLLSSSRPLFVLIDQLSVDSKLAYHTLQPALDQTAKWN